MSYQKSCWKDKPREDQDGIGLDEMSWVDTQGGEDESKYKSW